jgi:fimbrial chaperone protein
MKRLARHLLCLLPLAGAASAAHAGSAVVIWPVDPVIVAGQKSTALWVENRGKDAVTLQVRSFGWSQASGDNDYPRQDQIVTSPPIADIAPGQRQLVRVIRRGGAAPAGEHAFRLLIDELPKPIEPGAEGSTSATLAVQIRYSIPLFTYDSKDRGAPALSARTVLIEGQRFIQIRNSGTQHARLTDLYVMSHGHKLTIASGLAGYVLPGATMRWAMPAEAGADGQIKAGVNGAEQSLTPSA